MDVYLDLSFINFILISITSIYFVNNLLVKKVNIWLSLILHIINSLQIFILYFEPFLVLFIVILFEVIILYFLYKKSFINALIIYFSYSLLNNFIEYFILGNTVLINSVFIINSNNGVINLLIYPLIMILIYIVSYLIDKCSKLHKYKDFAFIIVDNNKYLYSAYIDTGNLLKQDNIPVIFMIKETYKGSKLGFDNKVIVNTISSRDIYYGKRVKVTLISSNKYQEAYLCLNNNKSSFNGCELLFNAFLL